VKPKVVDSQTHWYPRLLWDAYTERLDYPRCRRESGGYLFELAPDRWFPIRQPFYEIEQQLEVYEAAGIDAVVSSSASFGDVDGLSVDRAKEVAFALNELRAEAEREHGGRFYGLATIPWQDTDAALEVLEDAVTRLGLRGALIHSNVAGVPLDSEHLRPVYARLADLGVPLCLHPTRTIMEGELRDYGLEYLVGYMFDTSVAALRLVLSGILADLPALQVVHPHCGATLPYLAGRIDSSYSKPYSLGTEWPTPPSAYLAGLYTDTMSQSAETLAFARGFYGSGHVMFGSDFPYFQPSAELAFVRSALAGTGEEEAVLGENAVVLFGLD
jgi:aminocarboxymuconate-semialdehyde decarboxylase